MDQLTFWVVAGIILLIGEMVTTTFFMIFIALGCFAAALLNIWLPGNMPAGLAMCAVISVLGAIFLRAPLQRKVMSKGELKSDIGREVKIESAIAGHKQARITYQGTSWEALNIHHTELKPGDAAVIVGVDGNTLLIRKSE